MTRRNLIPAQAAGPAVGDQAPEVTLVDPERGRTVLSSFWADNPAVAVFLRYFGCPFCQAQVVNLREDRDRFDGVGARVVLIGQGPPDEAAAFAGRKLIPFACLIDPDRSAYRAYGLGRAQVSQVFGPRMALPFLKANVHRETLQRGLHGGSFWQMPGTFVIDRGGIVRLAHRNRDIADSPPNRVILETLAGMGHLEPAP